MSTSAIAGAGLSDEQRYRDLLDSAPVCIWEADLSLVKQGFDRLRAAGITDMRAHFACHPEEALRLASLIRILFINQETALYHSLEDVSQFCADIASIVRDDLVEVYREAFTVLASGGLRFEVDAPIVDADGGRRYIRIRGAVAPEHAETLDRVVIAYGDITEHKVAEERLRESAERFASIAGTSMDGFWVIRADGRILDVNDAICRMLGYSRDELLRLSIADVEARETAEEVDRHIALIMQAGPQRFETRLRSKIGPPVDAEISTVFTPGADRFLAFVRDVGARLRAEQALRESEERYRSLAEAAFEGIAVSDHGVFVDVNTRMCEMTGYEHSELIGREIVDFIAPEYRGVVQQHMMSMSSDLYEAAIVCKDGSVIPMQTQARSAPVGGKLLRVAAVRDITERNRSEQSLRESEERYRSLVDLAPDAILVHAGGSLLYANPAAVELFGAAHPSQLVGTPVLDRVHPDWRDIVRDRIWKTKKGASAPAIPEQLLRLDGTAVDVEVVATPIPFEGQAATLVVVRDITERKHAEEALLRERVFTDAVLDSVPGLLYVYDEDGRLLRWNKRHETMTGYSGAELLGEHILEWFKSDEHDTALIAEAVRRAMVEGYASAEARLSTKSGARIPLHFTAVRMELDGRRYFTGIGVDITERKQAEEALLEANRRLEQALADLTAAQQQIVRQERLRALGQMASGIAHDFNNLLTPILGYAEMLTERAEGGVDGPTVRGYLAAIQRAAEDARLVVFRLREFYRHREDTTVFLPVRVGEIIEQAVSLSRPRWKDQAQAAGSTIELETDIGATPTLYGNGAELREALINLIINASDAITQRAESLAGGAEAVDGCILVKAGTSDATDTEPASVVLTVADNGMGMTEETRRRCLEPFYSTKGERGTGLGLATVYGTIERHGGSIEVDSKWGHGTTFVIRLPVREAPASPALARAQEVLMRPLRVLVVDDEPAVRGVTTAYLAADGHYVEEATNGREGLDRSNAGSFDLIITDRAMPEMNGDQLARAAKQIDPSRPIILLTGFGDMMESVGEMPGGVDVVLGKPFTRAGLREAIARALGSSGTGGSPPTSA